MTEDLQKPEEDKDQRKKRLQHDAWKRWYESEKGKAYRQRRKEKKAQEKT